MKAATSTAVDHTTASRHVHYQLLAATLLAISGLFLMAAALVPDASASTDDTLALVGFILFAPAIATGIHSSLFQDY